MGVKNWLASDAEGLQPGPPGSTSLLQERGFSTPPTRGHAGGVIQVADEIEGFNFGRGQASAPRRSFDTERALLGAGVVAKGRPARRVRPTAWPSAASPRSAG